jgi:peptide/nickel transport system permease protein
MLMFLLRRFLVALMVALTVMTFAFMLTRLSGDLAISIAGANASQADVEVIRKAYGLDQPVAIQYWNWISRAAVGDFGESYFFKERVSDLIAKRLPITVTLGLCGLGLALLVSIPLGVLAAINENSGSIGR